MINRTKGGILTSISKPIPPEKLIDHRTGEVPEDYVNGPGYNAEMRWEAMSGVGYLTPTENFFVRNHAPTPRLDPAHWTLAVEGPAVGRSLSLSYDELLRLPETSVVKALECAGNGRVFFRDEHGEMPPGTPWRLGAIGVAEWTGVSLREILERAGIQPSARSVMAESLDDAGMRRPLPVDKALDDALVVYGMNGEALTPDHGFPARLLVPGWAAVASVKWLGRLFVSDEELYSPWNTEKYVLSGGEHSGEPVAAQTIKSALELPWPAELRAGRHEIRGRSWSPSSSISRVHYSLDGGEHWRQAAIHGPNLPGAWARWSFIWDAAPGKRDLLVRAEDEAGNAQPDATNWNDLGYLYDGIAGHPIQVS